MNETNEPGNTGGDNGAAERPTPGAALAEARRAAGLTVGQVSARTRVREALIHAIERDDYSLCGGDFYTRGHIRAIAREVGLDPEMMVQRYDELRGGSPPPVRAASVFQADRPIKLRERRSPNWTMAMVVALAIVVVFGVVRIMGGSEEMRKAGDQVVPVPTSAASGQGAQQGGGAAALAGEAEAARKAKAARKAERKKAQMVDLTVQASKPSYLSVRDAEGQPVFTGTLSAGQSTSWKIRKGVRLIIGNAGAVSLQVNGKDLGVSGAMGQTVQRSFDAPGASPS
ncbi:helix-turn-helix domain-containing protein [Sinosporangium siamense]|uniref:Cytoskeleton protein RodZ-like C-terminal domain-containing protein n=1 Tax=Sinosporangium siamense TaxID=1367973 RepID=A0A919V980_9ACTN|nr:RodZ domain-containing protein [Sinosporangium siamense]GII89869.1 hypothetical protein Ssi02_01000 [Sinosporangium siamense]